MKKLHCTLALVATLVSGSASAYMVTGNKLHDEMQKPSTDNMAWAFTRGFVAGVHDVQSEVKICSPSSANLGQMADMVKNYLENHPAIRHLPAEAIILHVLSTAWPCAKKGTAL
jgi:hypothetical protein